MEKDWRMRTEPLRYSRRDAEKTPSTFRECPTHGWTDHVRSGARGYYRCPACTVERVALRRRRLKEILVAEAGGRCMVCGYDAYAGALQFHHIDPGQKRFGFSSRRPHQSARGGASGGSEVRATVRKLPRGG